MIKSICLICGKEFLIRECKVLPTGNYCSRSCFLKRKPSKNGITKSCLICGSKFYCTPNRLSAKFCSQKCNAKNKHNKKQEQNKLCIRCGLSFVPFNKSQKCCSVKCKNNNNKTGQILPCTLCQKLFYVTRCKLKQKDIFCSTKCAINYSKKNQIPLVCKVCGKTFCVSKSSHKNRLCCSMICLRNLKINRLEELSYTMLDGLNIRYVKQYKIANKFVVDAYFPDIKLVVQFDGNYWHGDTSCYKKLNKIQIKNQQRDRSMDNYLKKCGFKVMRFWENDIKSNEKIFECIRGHNVA